MRDFKGMKRQRGRNRGGGGGKPQQQNANRAFDSNGPEGIKVRGAAQSVFEKYQQLARDASSAGDRVLGENYLQHAEHYFRTLRAMQPHRPVSDIVGREQFASGFDIDFEAEPEDMPEAPEAPEATEGGDGEGQRDGQRFEGRRDRNDRFEGRRDRDDRPRDDRPREERPRDERPRDDRPRDDRPREGGAEGGGRRDRWRERDERRDRERQERAAEAPKDPLAVIEPQATPLAAEAPRERAPRLRGQDGAVSELPAFLGRPAPAESREDTPADVETVKKPRRRRAPRSFEGGEGTPTETEDA
jgi:hypothetical protein